jgi:hypothetical protein
VSAVLSKKCTGALKTASTASIDTDNSVASTRPDGASKKAGLKLLASDILRLLSPIGGGQTDEVRAELHAIGSKRPFKDTMMWTHAFFFIGSTAALVHGLLDLFIINTFTAFLSMKYHHEYEKPGRIAQLEGTSAKALFLYGTAQIFQSPSLLLCRLEIALFSMTAIIFFITNLRRQLYDSLHFLMHVIPPIWVVLVACTHQPLIKLSF